MPTEESTARSVIGQGAGMTAMFVAAAGFVTGFKAGGIGLSLQRGVLGAVTGVIAGALIGGIGYSIAGSVKWAFRGALFGILVGTMFGAIMSLQAGKPGISMQIGWVVGAAVGTVVAACIERMLRARQTDSVLSAGNDDPDPKSR